jgi:hypothetical protein
MIDFADDFQGYLQDFGRAVTAKARTGLGVISHQTEIVVNGEIVYTGDSILTSNDIAYDLTHGDIVNYDGVSYVVQHDPFKSADGSLYRVPVTRLDPIDVPEIIISGGGAAPLTEVIYSAGGAP